MATANAGRISINLTAGTAQFVVDMEKANAKIREMGSAHAHAITGVQATSAALRTLEGNIGNNLRAAENFVAKTLGLGDALKNLFPVVGGIALLGTLGELAKKAVELGEEFKKVAEAPKRIATEFQNLVQPIRLSNAELQVQNDKLEIAVAKLSGHRENTLKLSLHEAAVEAEKLAESLGKDLDQVQKLLEQEQLGGLKAFLLGKASTSGLTEEFKKFRDSLTDISLQTADKLDATTDPAKRAAIYNEASERRKSAIRSETDALKAQLKTAESLQKQYENYDRLAISSIDLTGQRSTRPNVNATDQRQLISTLKGEISQLQSIQASFPLRAENTALTKTKERLEASTSNAKLDQPLRDYLAELSAKQRGAAAELAAALRSTGKEDFLGTALAKGYAAGDTGITSLNQRRAEAKQSPLTIGQRANIIAGQDDIALSNARTQARERQLQIEKEIQQGAIALGDTLTKEEAKRQDGLKILEDQFAAARMLSDAESKGAEAVFQAQLKIKLARIEDPEIRAKTEALDQAEHTAEISKTVEALNRETAAIQRMTGATLGGVQARRQAQLETIRQSGASQAVIDAQVKAQQAQYQLEDAAQLKGMPATAGIRAYFQEVIDGAQSAAMQVKNVLGGAFESLNDTLARTISGQKADWASFFQGISAELARLAIQNAELAAIRSLGLGGGSTGTGAGSSSGGIGGLGGILGGLLGRGGSAASRSAAAGGTPGFLSDGDAGSSAADAVAASSGILSKVGGFFGKLFGGFRAEGGSVDPGKAYMVGERGPELFTPRAGGGSITSNKMLGGTSIFYQINAGDTNSADVEQRVNRSLVAVHGSAVRNSAAVQAEMMRRKPRGA